MQPKINIIGAGVVGLCVARELFDSGAEITIFERGDGIGKHACSWWAGGMLAPYCEGETAEPKIVEMGHLAANWWQKHTKNVTQKGTLVVSLARDHAELTQFSRRTDHYESLNGNEISALEPDLTGRFQKGLFFKDEAHLAPRQVLTNLRDGLIADGVQIIQQDAKPQQLAKHNLTIDCRGLAAKQSLPKLRGIKGEMLIISCPDVSLSRPIRLLHPRIPIYIVPRGEGIYMLGATMIESSARSHVTARSMLELLSAAYALNPAFGEAEILEIGVDSRPAFPDNLPHISRTGNIISVNGLYRHGFLCAPALAGMVSNHIFNNSNLEIENEHSN